MVISYNLVIITNIIFEGGKMSIKLHLVLRLRMSGDVPPLSLYVFKACLEATLWFFAETKSGNRKRFSVRAFQLLTLSRLLYRLVVTFILQNSYSH